jgi:hypothetical protein
LFLSPTRKGQYYESKYRKLRFGASRR